MRGATKNKEIRRQKAEFQPTLPMRGATSIDKSVATNNEFQPTLPMRGATRPRRYHPELERVSTHAPHARSDTSVTTVIMPM